MSWLVHRWILLCGITLFVFNKACHGLFLRHTQSGRCITKSDEPVYYVFSGLSYYVVMTHNCLDVSGQFRYLDNEMLDNIETGGTLVAPPDYNYHSRWAVYKGVSTSGERYRSNSLHRLKQTVAGSLRFQNGICAAPSTTYVMRTNDCDKPDNQFTFGSVTNYDTKMENVQCPPSQHMVVKRADYGDFNNSGTFDNNTIIDTQCSALSNCQVKSHCGGNRSCELTMNNTLLPSRYCSNTSKEIYTEYTCVDSSNSNTITSESNIRLSNSPNEGFIEIKHGSFWRRVNGTYWDKKREKMLCQHLGYKEMAANDITVDQLGVGYSILIGDLICYDTQSNGTSCCVHLVPFETTSSIKMQYIRCKICDKPLLSNTGTFPGSVFSGSGDRYNGYKNARITEGGWCASGSGSYLLVDLQNEYHITKVVVMGNKNQKKWSESYSLNYSHDKTYKNSQQIRGNENGYQASTTHVYIYNVRYIKIQSNENTYFCLRIELCGEVQTPAPVNDINITRYKYAARVTWRIHTAREDSSYITKIIIYLNGTKYQTMSRGTRVIIIKQLQPNTRYKVEIETEDGSLQKSNYKPSKYFTTKKAGRICDKPLLEDIHRTFPNKVFSGNDGSNDYDNARLTGSGWCPSRSDWYLSLDLQKEYHITQVVVMGDRDQTKWSESYSMKYSHDETLVYTSSVIQIKGNQNGYQASTTDVVIYNVRYIKIQSPGNTDFCLRIELCGKVQTPAPVNYIKVTPSDTSAQVTLGNPAPETSSYITHYYIHLNESYLNTIRRQEPRTELSITGLTPFTNYTVKILARDGSSQWSSSTDKIFMTNTAVPSGAPGSVAFTTRSTNKLTVSWSAPSRNLRNGKLTGYRVCYSDKENSSNPSCFQKNSLSNTTVIQKLRPATKYFVTVEAATNAGYGPKNRLNPVVASHSSLYINITKPATYIKEVMIIVQVAPKNKGVSKIGKSDLKQYHTNTKDLYVTAYLKADVLPLTFVIGDGKEYNSANENYFNQPLKQNSSYIAYLRFFESEDSYYSTKWSNIVITLVKPRVPSGSPWNVTITKRSKNELTVSWRAPDQSLQTDQLTGYKVCYFDKARSSNSNCSVCYSDKARSRNPSCFQENDQSYTIVMGELRPATPYFVTVTAGTSGGYGPKSAEISKITNGESVNPVATSYSSLNLTIMKPATYIKEVMIIVQVAPKNRGVEDIGKSDLKPYQENMNVPYVTAYLKADVLPLIFVIGDGKEYNSEKEKYFNQLLEQNSNYIVFLRFFESRVQTDSYYSTEWSSVVKTMVKPGLSGSPLNVAFNSRGKTSLQVSWKAPEESFQNGELTGYQVCFYTKDTVPECLVFASSKVLSLTLDNLKPSTKYFVIVSASTTVGLGEKSVEVSKITSGEPVNPLTTSDYTLSLNIPKPAEYIREVVVIVQIVTNGQTPSENIKTSKLKRYQTNTQDPYITAYLKADVLPLTFVIGDGKVYSSEKEKYFNQPLEENSNYIVFLRFFESQDSYYSTEWSKSVKTMKKRPEQLSANNNTRLDVIIPPVILALCLLLSLAVILYQRRRLQNNNRKESHKLTLRQADQTGTSDSTPEPPNSRKAMEVIELTGERVSYVNDDIVYETPDDVIESIERNEAESKHEISTEEETSAYISLTDNKEPENFYQPLQTLGTSAHPHDTKGVDDQSAFNLNVSAV